MIFSLFLSNVFSSSAWLGVAANINFCLGILLAAGMWRFRQVINWRLIVKVFLASLVFSAMLGVGQFFYQEAFANKYLGLAYHSPATLAGESVIEGESGRFLRAYGSFDHPNIFGGAMVIALALLLELTAKWFEPKRWLFSSLIFLLLFLGLVLSFSRAAWLAFVIILIVRFMAAMSWRREKRDFNELKRLVLLGFLGAALILFIAGQVPDLFRARLNGANRLELRSYEERQTGIKEAFDVIKNNLWLGVGQGNYVNNLVVHKPSQPIWSYQPVHNIWLLLAAEGGIFIPILFSALWLVLFFFIKRENRLFAATLFAPLIIFGLVDHWLISLPFGFLLFCLVCSFALSLREMIK